MPRCPIILSSDRDLCVHTLLQDKEDADRAKSSLSLLASRVRQSLRSSTGAGELKEVAIALTRTLLTLEDRFKTPGFGQMRLRALVSLAVCQPTLVGPYLTREVRATHGVPCRTLPVVSAQSYSLTRGVACLWV